MTFVSNELASPLAPLYKDNSVNKYININKLDGSQHSQEARARSQEPILTNSSN